MPSGKSRYYRYTKNGKIIPNTKINASTNATAPAIILLFLPAFRSYPPRILTRPLFIIRNHCSLLQPIKGLTITTEHENSRFITVL